MRTLAALLCMSVVSTSLYAAYPEKPVKLVVGLPPGGAPDLAARVLAQGLGNLWGKPVVVETMVGAGGSVAAAHVAREPADGYALLFSGDAAMTTNVSLYKDLQYRPLRDFQPITLVVNSANVLLVNPSLHTESVKDLVALAKAEPGRLSYASAGNGTSQHLAGELLKQRANIDIVHVPYKGPAPAVQDLLAGRVQFTFANIVTALPLMRDGKAHGLAVTSLRRWPAAGELATVAESGYPGFEAVAWFGLLAPAGVPADIVGKIYDDALAVLHKPDVAARLEKAGLEIVGSTPERFTAQIRDEIESKGRLVQAAGLKVY